MRVHEYLHKLRKGGAINYQRGIRNLAWKSIPTPNSIGKYASMIFPPLDAPYEYARPVLKKMSSIKGWQNNYKQIARASTAGFTPYNQGLHHKRLDVAIPKKMRNIWAGFDDSPVQGQPNMYNFMNDPYVNINNAPRASGAGFNDTPREPKPIKCRYFNFDGFNDKQNVYGLNPSGNSQASTAGGVLRL